MYEICIQVKGLSGFVFTILFFELFNFVCVKCFHFSQKPSQQGLYNVERIRSSAF